MIHNLLSKWFVPKEMYDKAVLENAEQRGYIKRLKEISDEYRIGMINQMCKNKLLSDKFDETERELKEYKQKYADELQKRLELAEIVKGMESTNETE